MNETDARVDRRRELARGAWTLTDEVVLVGAGRPVPIPGGADQCFPYRPHPEYRWLTERRREGGVLAFDPSDGWTLFEPAVSEFERVWGGGPSPVGRPVEELESWLASRQGRKLACLGTPATSGFDAGLSQHLGLQLSHVRRPKDEGEIALLRRAARATAAGYAAAREAVRLGVSERDVQVAIECGFLRAGADGPGYATIVGTGPDSAVFHFTPGQRRIEARDLVLIDAGAEVEGYTSDVTRTFPGGGTFSSEQQDLFDAVREAERSAIEACRVGTEWHDVHRTAATSLAASLRTMGLLRCSPDEAVASEVIALFFPHGVGHMVGLGVRDAGAPLTDRPGVREVAGVKVRIDLPLAEGYVVTVEPGCYFIPALLNDPARRERFADQVAWDRVEPWIGTGGVRIEDNVLVTAAGPDVLTREIPV